MQTGPWLEYEGYGMKLTNNVIYDVWGAGLGVNGGYSILVAHNTMYRCADLLVAIGREGAGTNSDAGDKLNLKTVHVCVLANLLCLAGCGCIQS